MEDNRAASCGRFIYQKMKMREGRNNGSEALKVIALRAF